MRRGLAIDEQSYGPEHPRVATDLNNLASLLQATNRLAEAEPLMARVVSIFEMSLGENHPNVATALNNLAQLLQATNRLAEAEPLMRRALEIDEQAYGPEHPDVARDLNNLALLLQATNRLAEAEPLMRRVVEIFLQFTRVTGHPHPHLQAAIKNYSILLSEVGRSEAEIQARLQSLAEQHGLSFGN
jgi:tetratricopeptide (TPR) repeat protein